jgi:uncharacterized membrane protein
MLLLALREPSARRRHLRLLGDAMSFALQLLAAIVLGLMCGSELSVAAFIHPIFNRQTVQLHILMRASLAGLLGRVMPFWMTGSSALNLLLLLPFIRLNGHARQLASVSFAIQVVAILFSLVGPVPINKRIMNWTLQSLPEDWKAQEDRWDLYHWCRTCALVVAFAILVASVGIH